MKKLIAAAVMGICSTAAVADNVDQINTLSQNQFVLLSEDLLAGFSYKAGAPAEPLGITGFDIGVAASVTKVESSSVWAAATSSGDSVSSLVVPKLYLQKGLPFDIDVGAYYLSVPGANLDAFGAEIKYAVIDGSMVMPAVAIRGAVSALEVGDQLEMDTQSIDVSISKGVLMLTPYAGIGHVWGTSTPLGTAAAAGLKEADLSESRNFIGVSFNPGFFNLALERDSVGGIASYNFKMGLAW